MSTGYTWPAPMQSTIRVPGSFLAAQQQQLPASPPNCRTSTVPAPTTVDAEMLEELRAQTRIDRAANILPAITKLLPTDQNWQRGLLTTWLLDNISPYHSVTREDIDRARDWMRSVWPANPTPDQWDLWSELGWTPQHTCTDLEHHADVVRRLVP